MNILLHYLYGDLKSLSMRNRPFCALFEVAKMAENRRPGPFAKLLSRTMIDIATNLRRFGVGILEIDGGKFLTTSNLVVRMQESIEICWFHGTLLIAAY